jgi:hypothetical protein
MVQFEDHIVAHAVENAQVLFGKAVQREVVKYNFTSCVKKYPGRTTILLKVTVKNDDVNKAIPPLTRVSRRFRTELNLPKWAVSKLKP